MKESKSSKKSSRNPASPATSASQVVSQYISRGSFLENQGLIAQPYLDLYFKLYEGDGFLNKVTLNLGLWSSFTVEDPAGRRRRPDDLDHPAWYEFDYTARHQLHVREELHPRRLTYFEFNFPTSNFGTQRLGQVKLPTTTPTSSAASPSIRT